MHMSLHHLNCRSMLHYCQLGLSSRSDGCIGFNKNTCQTLQDKHKLNFREYSLSVTDALQQMLLKQVIRDRRREARQHLVQAQGRSAGITHYTFCAISTGD